MDKDGNQFRLFSGIIGHRRNGNAVYKEDQMRISVKRKVKKKLFLDGPWKLNGVTAVRHGSN
jgi:hypothetical protein